MFFPDPLPARPNRRRPFSSTRPPPPPLNRLFHFGPPIEYNRTAAIINTPPPVTADESGFAEVPVAPQRFPSGSDEFRVERNSFLVRLSGL